MLLFDESLLHRTARQLNAPFPGLRHVRDVGLARAADDRVRAYARDNGLAIVTCDADFFELATLHGAPPKVIWLRFGNASTAEAAAALLRSADAITAFLADPDTVGLELRSY
jgi:predicted nuclease of predicted toxin-antitoxin system